MRKSIMLEPFVAIAALAATLGSGVVGLNERVKSLEEKASYTKEKNSGLSEELKSLNKGQQEIKLLIARLEERLNARKGD